MMACKAGNGNPKCEYKRNAKGTIAHDKFGLPIICAYEGECKEQIEVK